MDNFNSINHDTDAAESHSSTSKSHSADVSKQLVVKNTLSPSDQALLSSPELMEGVGTTSPGGSASTGTSSPGGSASTGTTSPGGSASTGTTSPGGSASTGTTSPGGNASTGTTRVATSVMSPYLATTSPAAMTTSHVAMTNPVVASFNGSPLLCAQQTRKRRRGKSHDSDVILKEPKRRSIRKCVEEANKRKKKVKGQKLPETSGPEALSEDSGQLVEPTKIYKVKERVKRPIQISMASKDSGGGGVASETSRGVTSKASGGVASETSRGVTSKASGSMASETSRGVTSKASGGVASCQLADFNKVVMHVCNEVFDGMKTNLIGELPPTSSDPSSNSISNSNTSSNSDVNISNQLNSDLPPDASIPDTKNSNLHSSSDINPISNSVPDLNSTPELMNSDPLDENEDPLGTIKESQEIKGYQHNGSCEKKESYLSNSSVDRESVLNGDFVILDEVAVDCYDEVVKDNVDMERVEDNVVPMDEGVVDGKATVDGKTTVDGTMVELVTEKEKQDGASSCIQDNKATDNGGGLVCTTPPSCDTSLVRQRAGSVSGILKLVSQFDTPCSSKSVTASRKVKFASKPDYREPEVASGGSLTPRQGTL